MVEPRRGPLGGLRENDLRAEDLLELDFGLRRETLQGAGGAHVERQAAPGLYGLARRLLQKALPCREELLDGIRDTRRLPLQLPQHLRAEA